MVRIQKTLLFLISFLSLYLVVLFALGFFLEGMVRERISRQLKRMLRVDLVKIESVSLSVLGGRLNVKGIEASRKGIGHASLTMEVLDASFAAFGWYLFRRDLDLLVVSGAHIELSALGTVGLEPKQGVDVHTKSFVLRRSSLSFVPTSVFPTVGRATLHVHNVEASNLAISNAVSWLYQSSLLEADLELPGDMSVSLFYGSDTLRVGASVFGSVPISIPFGWPIPDPRDLEVGQILDLGKDVAKAVASEYAKRKARGMWDDVIDIVD